MKRTQKFNAAASWRRINAVIDRLGERKLCDATAPMKDGGFLCVYAKYEKQFSDALTRAGVKNWPTTGRSWKGKPTSTIYVGHPPRPKRRNPTSGEADRIAALRRIIKNCQMEKVDGVRVDLFSASAIVQVYDAINDSNKSKYARLPVAKMADIAFKIINKQNNRNDSRISS